jgi:hypothetical protein
MTGIAEIFVGLLLAVAVLALLARKLHIPYQCRFERSRTVARPAGLGHDCQRRRAGGASH